MNSTDVTMIAVVFVAILVCAGVFEEGDGMWLCPEDRFQIWWGNLSRSQTQGVGFPPPQNF